MEEISLSNIVKIHVDVSALYLKYQTKRAAL